MESFLIYDEEKFKEFVSSIKPEISEENYNTQYQYF
mgnify:CR=1 FL=1